MQPRPCLKRATRTTTHSTKVTDRAAKIAPRGGRLTCPVVELREFLVTLQHLLNVCTHYVHHLMRRGRSGRGLHAGSRQRPAAAAPCGARRVSSRRPGGRVTVSDSLRRRGVPHGAAVPTTAASHSYLLGHPARTVSDHAQAPSQHSPA